MQFGGDLDGHVKESFARVLVSQNSGQDFGARGLSLEGNKERKMEDYKSEWHRQDNKDLVLGFISAVSTCNFDQLAAVLSPDAVWIIPGDSLVSGPARGVMGIWHRCQMIRSYNVRLDFRHMLYSPYSNLVAAVLRNTGIRQVGYQGRGIMKFDEDVTQVYHIRNGKIHLIVNFISDLDNLNTYFQ